MTNLTGRIETPDGSAVKPKLSFAYPMGLPSTENTFGQRVLQARLNMAARLGRPVTQAQIAAAMGVTDVTVGRWEKNKKEPDLYTIGQLAGVLGVNPRWLAFGDDVNQEGATLRAAEPAAHYHTPAVGTPTPAAKKKKKRRAAGQ